MARILEGGHHYIMGQSVCAQEALKYMAPCLLLTKSSPPSGGGSEKYTGDFKRCIYAFNVCWFQGMDYGGLFLILYGYMGE